MVTVTAVMLIVVPHRSEARQIDWAVLEASAGYIKEYNYVGFPSSRPNAMSEIIWRDLQEFSATNIARKPDIDQFLTETYLGNTLLNYSLSNIDKEYEYLLSLPYFDAFLFKYYFKSTSCGRKEVVESVEAKVDALFISRVGRSLKGDNGCVLGKIPADLIKRQSFFLSGNEPIKERRKMFSNMYQGEIDYYKLNKKEIDIIISSLDEMYAIILADLKRNDEGAYLMPALKKELAYQKMGFRAQGKRTREESKNSQKALWEDIIDRTYLSPIQRLGLAFHGVLDEKFVDRDSVWAWIGNSLITEVGIDGMRYDEEAKLEFEKEFEGLCEVSDDYVCYAGILSNVFNSFLQSEKNPSRQPIIDLLERFLLVPGRKLGNGILVSEMVTLTGGVYVHDDYIINLLNEFESSVSSLFRGPSRDWFYNKDNNRQLVDVAFSMISGRSYQDFTNERESEIDNFKSAFPVVWRESKQSNSSYTYRRIIQKPSSSTEGRISDLDFYWSFDFKDSPDNTYSASLDKLVGVDINGSLYGRVESLGDGYVVKFKDKDDDPLPSQKMTIQNNGEKIILDGLQYFRVKEGENLGCLASNEDIFWRSQDGDTIFQTGENNSARWKSKKYGYELLGDLYPLSESQFAMYIYQIDGPPSWPSHFAEADKLRIIDVRDKDCNTLFFNARNLPVGANFNTTLFKVK